MRERELKQLTPGSEPGDTGSLPMRERELKQQFAGIPAFALKVAPHAGA